MTNRPSWDEYFLAIADAVSARADCLRNKHGAVLVKNNRIMSTGYNGPPSGDPRSCSAGDCPRGCKSPEEIQHLTGDYSDCIALHAEQNAIAYADYEDTRGATLYMTGRPCGMCNKLIQAAGIKDVVFTKEY